MFKGLYKTFLHVCIFASVLAFALNSLVIQAHVAWEETHTQGVLIGDKESGHHHHDSENCPTCKMLGIIASAQFDLAPPVSSGPVLPFLEVDFAKAENAQYPSARPAGPSQPRAPPPSMTF